MLASLSDHLLLNDFQAARLEFSPRILVQRGFADLRPRRVSSVKIGASLVRQQQFSDSDVADSSTLLMSLRSSEVRDLRRHLDDLPRLKITHNTVIDCFEALFKNQGSHIIAVVSDPIQVDLNAHTSIAQSILAQNPKYEQQFAKKILESMLTGRKDINSSFVKQEKLVVEEIPGKASILSFGDASWRAAIKRLQAVSGRDPSTPSRGPMQCIDGWGYATLRAKCIAANEQKSARNTATISCLSLRLGSGQVDLDTGRNLRAIATDWLELHHGIGLGKLQHIMISDPLFVVARHLSEAFAISSTVTPLLSFPDSIFGYQPSLSAIEFCLQPKRPALAIFTGDFPDVHLVAVS